MEVCGRGVGWRCVEGSWMEVCGRELDGGVWKGSWMEVCGRELDGIINQVIKYLAMFVLLFCSAIVLAERDVIHVSLI